VNTHSRWWLVATYAVGLAWVRRTAAAGFSSWLGAGMIPALVWGQALPLDDSACTSNQAGGASAAIGRRARRGRGLLIFLHALRRVGVARVGLGRGVAAGLAG